jgi:putative heme-binding domain-containing protein
VPLFCDGTRSVPTTLGVLYSPLTVTLLMGMPTMSSRVYARTVFAVAGFAAIALALAVGWPTQAANQKEKAKESPKRVPWTTSKVTGSPEPPPKFKSVRALGDVKFDHPDLIARCPGSERLYVGEQAGMIYSVKPGEDAKKEIFLDLRKDYKTLKPNPNATGIGELYGLVFHPKFAENRFCYVCYTLAGKGKLADGTRVSRFNVTKDDPPRIDPATEEIVIAFQGGGHNGGDLHFGPDGMLYISTGDGSGPNPPDTLNTGQDCTDLLSSILRIDVNAKDAGKNHAIPKDNPFVAMKDVRPEIWAFGFRNPWRMSFDREKGDLWVGDVGWELWEMVHKIEKGGNYGWSIVEGRQPVKPDQKIGPTPILAPTIELSHTIACSVTGGYVYRGKKFPELVGAYVFGDWETRRIWAARFENGRVKEMPEIVKPNMRVSAFGEDNAGEIYFAEYDTGVIYTLERNDAGTANAKFPTKLSETGLFVNVKEQSPVPGVHVFAPNAHQWQDGAHAWYYIALPGTSSVAVFDKPRPLTGQVFWHNFKMHFPPDAVLVKTIYMDVLVGDREERRNIETQILHCDGEDWRAYTFAWRDDQTDADLVPADGGEKTFMVKPWFAPKEKRERVWTFHSRSQCMSCHNSWAEYALAFNVGQLNNSRLRGEVDSSQLVDLCNTGLIRRVGDKDKPLPPYDVAMAAKEPIVANTYGGVYTLEERARAYLHVNCAHCHRFGGGGGQVVLELDHTRPLKEMGIIDAKPRQGDFGIPDGRLVAPGDPNRSVLLYRMAKFGGGRMPHLGSENPHGFGVELIDRWIRSMGKDGAVREPLPRSADGFDKAVTRLDTVLPFAVSLHDSGLKGADRERVLAAAAKLEPGPVRDLFEGYLPPDPKGRKLGSNPRPATILALTGDAKKGEAIFFNKDIKCANCHKVGEKGTALGPDLTAIGKTRSRTELLESLLQPSVRVETQYAAYNVRTKDEKSFTGLIVKRDEKQLVLRDAENKEIVIAGADVESVRPSRLSLMPDGQMSGLTPQEAADLLEYLVQRK